MEATVWPNEDIIAKDDLCTIENDKVMVGKEILSYLNIISIVAPERGNYGEISLRSPEQPAHQSLLCIVVRWAQMVIIVAEVLGACTFGQQFLVVVGIINQPCQHLVLLCHIRY